MKEEILSEVKKCLELEEELKFEVKKDGVKDENGFEFVYAKRRWIECLCIVGFDNEIGQQLESVYPSEDNHPLSADNFKTITMLAFPESYSMEDKSNRKSTFSHKFFFSFRKSSCSIWIKYLFYLEKRSEEVKTKGIRDEKDYYYGYVFYKQRKDPNNSRGHVQKSVVIISRYSLPVFFTGLSKIIGNFYFGDGATDVLQVSSRVSNKSCRKLFEK